LPPPDSAEAFATGIRKRQRAALGPARKKYADCPLTARSLREPQKS